MKNPPAGSKTVSVSINGKTASIKLASAVFTGVSTTTDPLDTVVSASGTSGAPTASLTTAVNGELVTANASVNATTAATNRTSIWKDIAANNTSEGSYQLAPTSGSYSNSYTGTTAAKWAELIAAFKPNVTTKPGTPITVTSSSLLYIHTDHLGGANVITDKNGVVVETLDYYPYGEVKLDEKTSQYSSKRKYIGEEYDSATDLSYLNARYYNGKEGRFLSEDPVFWEKQNLVDPQSMNSYSYANGNPIVKKDPSGRCAGIPMSPIELAAMILFMPRATSFDPVYEPQQYAAQNSTNNAIIGAAMSMVGGKSGRFTADGQLINAVNGARREAEVFQELKQTYPTADIIKQPYLRDANGKIVKDFETSEARRLDFAVVQDGQVASRLEVTSQTAKKDFQIGKEGRIISNGGTFIRGTNGSLLNFANKTGGITTPSVIIRKP